MEVWKGKGDLLGLVRDDPRICACLEESLRFRMFFVSIGTPAM